MTDDKWEVYDKDALVVEYARQRRQRLQDAIGEFLNDEEATVKEMVDIIKTEITEWLEYYQKGSAKCVSALEALKGL
jgi:hypothetical protein